MGGALERAEGREVRGQTRCHDLEEPLRPLQVFEPMLSEVAETGGGRQPLPNQLRRGRGQKHLPTVGSSREPRALRALIMEKLSKARQLIKEAAAI